MNRKPHILIAEARFYAGVSDLLLDGAVEALAKAGTTHDIVTVPGALEIPAAIKIASQGKGRPFDACVALGCVIRGETYHFEVVAHESARGLTLLALDPGLVIGNGILTCETEKQALERARQKGSGAVQAALALLDIKRRCGA